MYNPYSAYKRQTITTMTPMEIVVKLYDECEKQLNCALHFIDAKDYAKTNAALTKASDIVDALRSVLDMKIEMSKNLDSLYEYFSREIIQANVKKDKYIIEKVLPQISELKDAFVQISKMPKNVVGNSNFAG